MLGKKESRRIYDKYGETGLDVLDRTGNAAVTDFILNNRKQAWVVFGILVLILNFLAFPFLVAAKASGKLSWRWVLVCIPLWIFHVLAFALILVYVFLSGVAPEERDAQQGEEAMKQRRSTSPLWAAAYICLAAFTVLAACKLDSAISRPWRDIALSYFMFEGLLLMTKAMLLYDLNRRELRNDPVLHSLPGAFLWEVYWSARWSFVRIWFMAVAIARLDGSAASLTWDAGFAALYICLVSAPIVDFIYWKLYQHAAYSSSNADRLPSRLSVALYYVAYWAWTTFWLALAVLLHIKLQFSPSLSWIWVLFPILGVAGLSACCILCAVPCVCCCCMVRSDDIYLDEGNDDREGRGNPMAPEQLAASVLAFSRSPQLRQITPAASDRA